MSRRVRRNADGQFAAGESGNPDGARLRKPRQVLTPTDLYQINMAVAGEVIGKLNGRPVTRYENVLRSLAKGDSLSRLAAKDFLEQVTSASHFLERAARRAASGYPGS